MIKSNSCLSIFHKLRLALIGLLLFIFCAPVFLTTEVFAAPTPPQAQKKIELKKGKAVVGIISPEDQTQVKKEEPLPVQVHFNTSYIQTKFPNDKEKNYYLMPIQAVELLLDGKTYEVKQLKKPLKEGDVTFDVSFNSLPEDAIEAKLQAKIYTIYVDPKSPKIDVIKKLAAESEVITVLFLHNINFGTPTLDPQAFFYDEQTKVSVRIPILPEPDITINTVELYRTDSSGSATVIGQLNDSGDVTNNDDIANDGIYSGFVTFQETVPSEISLKALVNYTLPNNNSLNESSDLFIVEAVEHISDVDYQVALTVPNEAKQKYDEFLQESTPQEAKLKVVEWLEQKPEIGKAGLSEAGEGVWWVYESGLLGGMFLSPEGTKGNVGSNKSIGIAPFYDEFSNQGGDDIDGAYKKLQESQCPVFNTASSLKNEQGDVESFKQLTKYGVIIVSSHGDTWYNGILSWWNDNWGANDEIDFFENLFAQTVVLTRTKATDENKKQYEIDLKQHRLAITNSNYYAILPGFIKHYNKKFPDSLVYMSSCRSLYNSTLSNAFLQNGAKAYIGYTEYVPVPFAFASGNTLFQYLIDGKTVKEAYDLTVTINGKCNGGACLDYKGDDDLTIAKTGILNGSFESELAGWTTSGDTRIVPKLGPINPTEGNYMAIISTGLGSVNESSSEVEQSFCIGIEPTSLSFDYNVVSEEPMEWVGSIFDDKFQVLVVKDDGTEESLAFESINGSTWQQVDGIDFYGGDSTTYMTGWKHVNIDISNYSRIKAIKFIAKTWDMGDSIYDTAALLDNIKLSIPEPEPNPTP